MPATISLPDETTAVPSQRRIRDRHTIGRQAVLIAAAIALVVKLFMAWNTFGTNDVVNFYLVSKSLVNHGLEWTYQNAIWFNHPPLTACYLCAIYSLHHLPLLEASGITFPFLLR